MKRTVPMFLSRRIILLPLVFGVFSCCISIQAQQAVVQKATGTGRTTGHVITLTLANESDKAISGTIESMTVPSGGQYQGQIIDQPVTYNIPPGGTISVPGYGYCTDVFLPAPPPGALLPTPVVPADPALLEPLVNIVDAVVDLQETGQITTPFSGSPESERQVLIQQTVWIYTTAGTATPYGFTEFCDRIQQQSGMPGSTLSPGINQLWDAILAVGTAAAISPFIAPPLPPASQTITPAQGDMPPGIEITAKGTGRTTGHIADLIINNGTDQPFDIQLGPGSKPNAFYIPSGGQYQPYIVPYLPPMTVPPRQTLTFPVEGFCVDIHRPPVPSGNGMPKPGEWLSIPVPRPDNMAPGNLVNVPTAGALPLNDAIRILQNTQAPIHQTSTPTAGSDCIRYPTTTSPTVPGTDIPITQPLIPDQQPGIIAPLLLQALNNITRTYDKLRDNDNIQTPFSGNPEKEREAVIQQTFWIYTSALSGDKYVRDDFRNNTIKQFEQSSGKPFAETPPQQQDRIDQGVDDFWDSFNAVGVEAKVLNTPPAPATLPVENFWENYNTTGAKPRLPGSTDPGQSPDDLQIPPGDPNSQPELIQDNNRNKCACGAITFESAFTPPPAKEGQKPQPQPFSFSNEVIPNKPQKKIQTGPTVKTGDQIQIELNNLKTACSGCNNRCKAENVKVTISSGPLNTNNGQGSNNTTQANITTVKDKYSATVTVADGKEDFGIFITIEYVCNDSRGGRNPCESAACSDVFLLKLPRAKSCDCGDVQFALDVTHKPAAEKDPKPTSVKFGEGKMPGQDEEINISEQEWEKAVSENDVITIKMKTLTAKCTGCDNTCTPGAVSLVISGEGIDGLKTSEEAAKKPTAYRANANLLTAKKVKGGNGPVNCVITVKYTCTGKAADCKPKDCEKSYTLTFKRS